jgi:hypothetical protein
MTECRQRVGEQEPMGIIISQGSRSAPLPKFSAYVWGEAPEPAPEPPEAKAA